MRAAQMKAGKTARYDGHCMSLSAEEVKSRLDGNTPHVVRMKVPEEGTCLVQDKLRGEIEIDWSQIEHASVDEKLMATQPIIWRLLLMTI